jgi:stringent starvation protein B
MASVGGLSEGQGPSTRPYLIRALHEWCTDNGFTPYIAVHVDNTVQVPAEYVKNNEIVLNVGFEATSGLKLGNETIEFKARFGGSARDIHVPIDHVVAIYARENGQGMAFPMPSSLAASGPASAAASALEAPAESAKHMAPKLAAVVRPGDEATNGAAKPASPLAPAPEPPPSTPAGGGAKPSLKRIK